MEKEIVFAGFGGQGVLTAGLIVAHAANAAGLNVLWMPAYGGQMRGGRSYSLVKISEDAICHPDIEALDVLVAMNQPSLEGFSGYVKDGGLILINSNTVGDEAFICPENIRSLRVPFADLARSVDNPKGANIVALGVLLAQTDLFPFSSFEEEMLKYFTGKGKASYARLNSAALETGYNFKALPAD